MVIVNWFCFSSARQPGRENFSLMDPASAAVAGAGGSENVSSYTTGSSGIGTSGGSGNPSPTNKTLKTEVGSSTTTTGEKGGRRTARGNYLQVWSLPPFFCYLLNQIPQPMWALRRPEKEL